MAKVALDPQNEIVLYHDMLTTSTTDVQAFTFGGGYRILKLSVEVLGLTGETLAFKFSSDGTNYGAATGVGHWLDLGTGLSVGDATFGNGKFQLTMVPPTVQKFSVTKSAGVETVYVSVAAVLVPNV